MATHSTRRRFLKGCAALCLGGGLAGAGGYGYGLRIEPRWLVVEHVTVVLERLPPVLAATRIALMSDLHLRPRASTALIDRAVATVNDLAADLVLLAGDYVLSSADAMGELAPLLARLEARHGVYASLGNHDLWTDAHVVTRSLREAGITVLVNEGRSLSIGDATLYVAGLDDGWSGVPDLEAALSRRPAGVPTVVLMHEPDWADTWAHDGRVDLQLSGHSHGGQVRLPGLGALILPRYGRKYDQGLYRVGDMWLYTTRGIGVVGPPVRFCCRPEITEITLVAKG